MNRKRVYRVWRERGLSLSRRVAKKRGTRTGHMPHGIIRLGHVWTDDVVHDTCANGRPLKRLTVVDELTRECLGIAVGTSRHTGQVMAVWQRLFSEHGPPEFLRSDNGPEFVAIALKAWLGEQGAGALYIDPGCPW
jgi:putative transposase